MRRINLQLATTAFAWLLSILLAASSVLAGGINVSVRPAPRPIVPEYRPGVSLVESQPRDWTATNNALLPESTLSSTDLYESWNIESDPFRRSRRDSQFTEDAIARAKSHFETWRIAKAAAQRSKLYGASDADDAASEAYLRLLKAHRAPRLESWSPGERYALASKTGHRTSLNLIRTHVRMKLRNQLSASDEVTGWNPWLEAALAAVERGDYANAAVLCGKTEAELEQLHQRAKGNADPAHVGAAFFDNDAGNDHLTLDPGPTGPFTDSSPFRLDANSRFNSLPDGLQNRYGLRRYTPTYPRGPPTEGYGIPSAFGFDYRTDNLTSAQTSYSAPSESSSSYLPTSSSARYTPYDTQGDTSVPTGPTGSGGLLGYVLIGGASILVLGKVFMLVFASSAVAAPSAQYTSQPTYSRSTSQQAPTREPQRMMHR